MIEEIGKENDEKIEKCLEVLNLKRDSLAKDIYSALIKKISKSNLEMTELLGNPECNTQEGCEKIVNYIKNGNKKSGFFLKKEKFFEILKKEPPKKIMESLGYGNVDEMLEKEDWKEIASALRFMEGISWMNENFLPYYNDLSPDDFEEREVHIIAISNKWKEAAKKFIEKKYHNISHLKELGIIFVIPATLNVPGEIIRTVSLLLHYSHEVDFYSDLFVRASKNKDEFSSNLIKLLRGDIVDDRKTLEKNDWLVVQRYLAKTDEFDWRLFYRHVNPEAIHWEKAEIDISKMGEENGMESLAFWKGLNWIGDYFSANGMDDTLISFNIVDNAMSLVKEKEMIKYLYHHQEAMWNKIFTSYFGENEMENKIKENIINGIIKL